jgi:GntR family transcriptional regulator
MADVNDSPPPTDALGIRRADAVAAPLYEVVKDAITEAILVGRWPAGTVLPNEIALAARFGVAHGTLRRALADLTAEGLLSRRRKAGTVVTGRPPRLSLRFFFRFYRLHGTDGTLQQAEVETLSVDRGPATGAEAGALGLATGAAVIRVRRLRRVDGRPVMLDRFVLPADRVPGLPEAPAAFPARLYLTLLEAHGLRIVAVREALGATLADAETAALLAVEPGAPLLLIDEVAFDPSDRPTVLGHHLATTTAHRYVNEIR